MKRKRPELSPQKLTIICWKMLDGEYQLRKKEFNCKNNQVAGRVILTHTHTQKHKTQVLAIKGMSKRRDRVNDSKLS